jgi:hypothetical protein
MNAGTLMLRARDLHRLYRPSRHRTRAFKSFLKV